MLEPIKKRARTYRARLFGHVSGQEKVDAVNTARVDCYSRGLLLGQPYWDGLRSPETYIGGSSETRTCRGILSSQCRPDVYRRDGGFDLVGGD